jgi:hypothetical protein
MLPSETHSTLQGQWPICVGQWLGQKTEVLTEKFTTHHCPLSPLNIYTIYYWTYLQLVL